MRASEWRKFSKEELQIKLNELREELFKLRLQHSTGQLENVKRISAVKKDIARILTILNEQER
ncbi:MAG: 50S ribosomal protein L29 [Candidatus Desulfofervidus auxilii]|nr:50S ribosomal protein L29 [Candidatus Desulfofervidus auxilii]